MNKKSCMLLLIFAFFFIMISNTYAVGVDVGGKFGVGMGWWRGSDYGDNVDKVTGAFDFIIGPYCSLDMHEYVAMQFELVFSYLGSGDEVKTGSITYERAYRNYALQIPVLVKPKFRVGPGDIFILFGPSLLILLDDFTLVTTSGNVETTSTVDVGRQFHLGIACGLGYDWELGPGKLQFAIKITPFLTNYGSGNYNKAYQNEFTFDFGYAYSVQSR